MSAVTPRDPTAAPRPGSASPEWGGFDPRGPRGRGSRDTCADFRTAVRLGWQMEANWTDPVLFFIYSVAKPVVGALILVVMLDDHRRRAPARATARSSSSARALWSFVLAGIAGLAWSVLDDRERYRMLQVRVRQPERLPRRPARPRRRPAGGRARWARVITLAVGVVVLGVPFDVGADRLAAARRRHRAGHRRRSSRSACCSPRSACRPARSRGRTRRPSAGALFLVTGVVFPLAVLPGAGPGGRPADAAHLVDRGRPPGALPGRPDRPSAGRDRLWTAVTGTAAPDRADDRRRLAGDRGAGYTRRTGVFRSSERRAKDRGLLDQTTGS